MCKYAIGVDVGGTKTEAVLFDVANLAVLERVRIGTPAEYHLMVREIKRLAMRVSSALAGGISDVDRVGICTPGTERGRECLVTGCNVRALQGRPLRRDVQRAMGRTVTIENDANCFALAEALMGAGSGFDAVFGVIMGTGAGGGIIVDRKVYRGRTGMAGEWGHHTLHTGGRPCYCGRYGCAEAYLSGPALEDRWFELTNVRLGMPQIAAHMSGQGSVGGDGGRDNDRNRSCKPPLSPDGYERQSYVWFDEAIDNFGRALANVVDIMDPDVIVLGGGLSNMDMWYDAGAASVRKNVFSDAARDLPIVRNQLGDSAGVIGACLV